MSENNPMSEDMIAYHNNPKGETAWISYLNNPYGDHPSYNVSVVDTFLSKAVESLRDYVRFKSECFRPA